MEHRPLRLALIATSLAGFLCGTAGFPLVVPATADKDRSEAFPCMDHACGCKSAAACWLGCCCFTMTQKLAWAKKNGATPPAYVVAAAAREAKTASCCNARAGCHADHEHAAQNHHSGASVRVVFVLTDASRKCQGLAPLWMLLSATTLTPPATFETELHPRGEVALSSPRLLSLSIAPAVPPPRGA